MIARAAGYLLGRVGVVKSVALVGGAVFLWKAGPDLRQYGQWVGAARAYAGSLVAQLHLPALPVPSLGGGNRIVTGLDGYNSCMVEGWINGRRVDFLADSGASIVSLNRRDAAALGFNPNALTYNHPYESANGTGYAARVRIRELRIGERTFADVVANIDYEGFHTPLLGMSILKQYEVRIGNGSCELRW